MKKDEGGREKEEVRMTETEMKMRCGGARAGYESEVLGGGGISEELGESVRGKRKLLG